MFKTLLFLFVFLPAIAAHAAEDHPYDRAKTQHKKTIDTCKAKSQPEWNTGRVDSMYDGANSYIDCLHQAITKTANVFFIDPNGKQHKVDFLQALKLHTEAAYKVYYFIYNGACNPCATLNNSTRMMPVAHEMENILLEMLQQAHENDRPIKDYNKP